MRAIGIGIIALLVLVAAVAIWHFFSSPVSYVALAFVAAGVALKFAWPLIGPKNYTPDQVEKLRSGENPFGNHWRPDK